MVKDAAWPFVVERWRRQPAAAATVSATGQRRRPAAAAAGSGSQQPRRHIGNLTLQVPRARIHGAVYGADRREGEEERQPQRSHGCGFNRLVVVAVQSTVGRLQSWGLTTDRVGNVMGPLDGV